MTEIENPLRQIFVVAAGIHINTKRWVDKRLKAHGMTYPQYGALAIISEYAGIMQKELAQAMQTDTTNTMVICDALERKKWLERKADPSDRRVNRLNLTNAGKEAFCRAQPEIEAGFEAATELIDEKGARMALETLGQIYARVKTFAEQGKR